MWYFPTSVTVWVLTWMASEDELEVLDWPLADENDSQEPKGRQGEQKRSESPLERRHQPLQRPPEVLNLLRKR